MRLQENELSRYDVRFETSLNGPGKSYAKNLFWMVFANSRGGNNRIRIVAALKRSPLNAHQLAKELGLNYRAIQHHMGVLEKNNLVSHVGKRYGTVYYLAELVEVNMKIFEGLAACLSEGK